MNESGALLVIAGVWVLAQVFAGNALGRLGIVGSPDATAKTKAAPAASTTDTGVSA